MDQEEIRQFINGLDEVTSIMHDSRGVLNSLTSFVFASYLTPSELRLPDPFPEMPSYLELLPIDLLGKYEPEKLEISIYFKRIEQVASIMGVHYFPLLEIVLLHEWSHALVHVGLTKSDEDTILKDKKSVHKIRKRNNSIFHSISEETNELIAQLLTYHGVQHICRNNSRYTTMNLLLKETFEILQKLQPHKYRIDDFKDVNVNRVAGVLDLVKSGDLHPRSVVRVLKMS